MLRLALDTNIALCGLLWGGAPCRLLQASASTPAMTPCSQPLMQREHLIVSGDGKHLLVLQRFEGIPIVTASAAVETCALG